jgi:mRNA interferase MazF
VILVRFPFSDLTGEKVRPAVVLADVGRGDWVLCQITSNPYGDPFAVPLTADDFRVGSLRVTSYARPGKLFTANRSLISGHVGELSEVMARTVVDSTVSILRLGVDAP